MDLARIPANPRRAVGFGFTINGPISTRSATAPDAKTATAAVAAFKTAYVQTRAQSVADGATSSTRTAQSSLDKLRTKLSETEQQIGKLDPALLHRLLTEPTTVSGSGSGSSGSSGSSAKSGTSG